ncbi:MAG TPA: hypothetical protein VG650_15980 [Mycobacteriales bacterium]|nr:hypothetical protein [Mycobacteriales bacterium]
MSTMTDTWARAETLAAKFIEFLETNTAPDGLYAEDVFVDLSLPQWRLQTTSAADLVALRRGSHPYTGQVPRHRVDATERGFVIEFEERWTDDSGQEWYCREMIRADVGNDGLIHQLSVYCTGDWDAAQIARHAAEVTLSRP